MEFLAPLMLVGAAFVAMPVIIHLIGRRRAKVVRFAAMDFLLGSRKKTAKRLRVRHLLLLLLRVFICLAIPLALAKPFTSCRSSGPVVLRGPQAAVLVIDDSFAATYRLDGQSLLSRAKEEAARILDQIGPEADIAVVRTSEGAPSPTELSRDHIGVRDLLSEIRATSRVSDTATALRRAAQLLAASNHERRVIYLISPLAASGIENPAALWPGGKGPAVEVVDVAGGRRLDNLAVTDIRVKRDPDAGSRGVEVTAEVANFSERPATEHGIRLRINDHVVARGAITLAPGQTGYKGFVAAVPGSARFADVIVELERDPLTADNRRFQRAELREEVRVLLVNGDPRTARYDDELFYLSAALRPGDRSDSGTALASCTFDELSALELADYDVLVLANVRALDAALVARLAAWVRAGGGLLLAPGSNVDTEAYNQTMLPLLPQTVKDAIEVAYGARGKERDERALRLSSWEADHPIFSVFTKDAPGLREARFHTILLLGPTTRVDERRVLARYTNGAVALVEAKSGLGRMLLYTSTVDRDWNDLAIHPGYLPLWQQAVRYLARKHDQRGRADVLVAKSALLGVADSDARIEVTDPDGKRSVIEGQKLEGRKYVRFGETQEPGFYRVTAVDRQGKSHRRMEADFAVNLDTRGSDLAPVDARLLVPPERLDGGPVVSEHQRRVELWHAIALGLLLLLLLESLITLR